MSKQCQICSNPNLEEIENDINSGNMSIRGIARLHDLQHDALQRHTSQHMGVVDTTDATSDDSDFDTLAEINYLFRKNKAALNASKNPVQCQKLIAQQITLIDMRKEYLKEQRNTTKHKSAQLDYARVNKDELEVLIRIQNRAMGLHDQDVIKDGWVTRDPDGEQSRPIPLSMLDEDE